MKVVEYWHETIKIYRYDGDVLVVYIPVTPVIERDKTHICIIAIKDKTMVFIHIGWVYFVYIMSYCLRRYFVLYELIL